jgi:hypothetical protein
MSELPDPSFSLRDRDLLVRLDAKLDGLSGAFSDVRMAVGLKADTSRVDKLERQIEEIQTKAITAKADAVRVDKVESMALAKADAVRVEKLESMMTAINNKLYTAAGALGAIQIVVHLFWK